jgi:hypothetical protein
MDGDTRSSSLGAPLDNGLYNGPLGAALKPLAFTSKRNLWRNILESNFASNIVAAYDFRDLDGPNLLSKIGPNLQTFGVIPNKDGLLFSKSIGSWAYSNTSILFRYPFTMVFVAITDNTIATPTSENVLMHCNTAANGYNQASFPGPHIFTRTFQTLMPYNGQDNQTTGYLPNGTEWYFFACSFLNNGTVRYATRKPSGNLNGTVSANNGTTFNGFPGFGHQLYGFSGTMRLGLFINRSFSNISEMDGLFNLLFNNGPASDLKLQ